jgi:hypothetical protein
LLSCSGRSDSSVEAVDAVCAETNRAVWSIPPPEKEAIPEFTRQVASLYERQSARIQALDGSGRLDEFLVASAAAIEAAERASASAERDDDAALQQDLDRVQTRVDDARRVAQKHGLGECFAKRRSEP